MGKAIDWWWKMNLLTVCVEASFCQIRSQINFCLGMKIIYTRALSRDTKHLTIDGHMYAGLHALHMAFLILSNHNEMQFMACEAPEGQKDC